MLVVSIVDAMVEFMIAVKVWLFVVRYHLKNN